MTTKAKIGDSVFDVATRIYGHATGVFWLLEDNESLTITTEFEEETELITRNDLVRLLEVDPVVFKAQKLPKYVLKPRQGFFDVLIENQGDILGVFDLIEANNFDGFTEHLFEADELEILADAVAPRIKDALGKYMPIATIEEEDKSDGIGYMFVERNFLIR